MQAMTEKIEKLEVDLDLKDKVHLIYLVQWYPISSIEVWIRYLNVLTSN